MSPISPVAWKVITVAALLVAGGLLYACPSSSQCPLVQILSLGRQRHAASRPEATTQPATEPAVATTQSEPGAPPREGETVPTLEPKPQPVGEVLHADLENFERIVLESEAPVLVDFYADWCRPCQMLAPTLEELAREMPEARIVKVNVDDSPELAGHFGVSSIPALMVFKDGDLVAKRLGVLDKGSLRQLLGS
jgi:thioredoxin 1